MISGVSNLKNMGASDRVINGRQIWWLLMVAGFVLISIGSYALFEPWNTFIYLVKYTGIALIISSVLLLVFSITTKLLMREVKWLILESIIDLAFAVILVFNPFLTVIAFPFLIGWWIILRGIIKISFSLSMGKLLYGWLVVLIIGILSLVFGILMISYHFENSRGISMIMSIYCLMMGALYVYDSVRFKNKEATLTAII